MTNVAGEPSYAEVRARLERAVLRELEAQEDPRLTEQPCRYEYEPFAGRVSKIWFESAAEEQALFNPTGN